MSDEEPKLWTGRIETLVPGFSRGDSRYYQQMIVVAELEDGAKPSRQDQGDESGGDDDDDSSGSQAEEVSDDEEGGSKKRKKKRKKRTGVFVPKNRLLIRDRNHIPLPHAGAVVGLLLVKNGTHYDVHECTYYEPATDVKSAMLRMPLCDAQAMLAARDRRVAERQELIAENLVEQVKGKPTKEAQVPRVARALLASVQADPHHWWSLARIMLPFHGSVERTYGIGLQRSLEMFYAIQSALGHTPSPQSVARTASGLVKAPLCMSASFVEQHSARQLVRSSVALKDYCDALLVRPEPCGNAPCGGDVVFRNWRYAAPEQAIDAAELPRIVGRLPTGASFEFLWSAARWFSSQRLRYGATLVESGEQTPVADVQPIAAKPAENDDDDDVPLSEAMTLAQPVGAEPSRAAWLVHKMSLFVCAPPQCHLKTATTQLLASKPAVAVGKALIDALRSFDTRVSLVSTRTSGYGVLALDESVYYDNIVELRYTQTKTSPAIVVLVFASAAHQARYAGRTQSQNPARYSLHATHLAALLCEHDSWNECVVVQLARRVVLIDAHLHCEHDMRSLLCCLAENCSKQCELLIVGESESPAPDPHHESGAPFVDMWRCGVFACSEHEASVRINLLCRLRDLPTAAGEIAHERTEHALLRARDIVDQLIEGKSHWQACGGGADVKQLTSALADLLAKRSKPSHSTDWTLEHRNTAERVASALSVLSKMPWRARSDVAACAPYVVFRSAVLRVLGFFVLERESDRTSRVDITEQLSMCGAPLVSLDARGLYLRLDSDLVDHRRCCFTNDAQVLCVARHRNELRAASFVGAREMRGVHSYAGVLTCLLVLLPDDSNRYIDDKCEAEQLVQPECLGAPSVYHVMPRATPEMANATEPLLVATLQRRYGKPPTVLGALLQDAYGCVPKRSRSLAYDDNDDYDYCEDSDDDDSE